MHVCRAATPIYAINSNIQQFTTKIKIIMIGDIIIYVKIVFLLSEASIRYFEIFFNTDGDFEFINDKSIVLNVVK